MSELQIIEQRHAVSTLDDCALSLDRITGRVKLVHEIMKNVMKDGMHYGKIPGTGDKPSLLKPGAEKIAATFQLAPELSVQRDDLPGGHREYTVTCTLYSPSGSRLGQGVGSATTLEGKFRFRQEVISGAKVTKEYWETRDSNLLGGPNRKAQKRDGLWVVVERVEHDNPADYYNTVLKMAKKRAFVDAVLTVTGASDIFTQDVEDMPEVMPSSTLRASTKTTETQPEPAHNPNRIETCPDCGKQLKHRKDGSVSWCDRKEGGCGKNVKQGSIENPPYHPENGFDPNDDVPF